MEVESAMTPNLGPSGRARGAKRLLVLSCLGLLLVSCASPQSSGSVSSNSDGSPSTNPATTNRGPKTINIGMQLQEEPSGRGASTGIINITGPGTTGGSGTTEHRLTFHAGLTILD